MGRRKEGTTMAQEAYKAMAERIAIKYRVMKISVDHYENKRNCPFYSELRGMEIALKTLGINYEYTYNDDCEIVAISVEGETVEI